jgi:hypothetical protein
LLRCFNFFRKGCLRLGMGFLFYLKNEDTLQLNYILQ